MAEIPVAAVTDPVANDARTPTMPLWAALIGLAAIIALVWMLFSLGAQGSNADGPTDEPYADIRVGASVVI